MPDVIPITRLLSKMPCTIKRHYDRVNRHPLHLIDQLSLRCAMVRTSVAP